MFIDLLKPNDPKGFSIWVISLVISLLCSIYWTIHPDIRTCGGDI